MTRIRSAGPRQIAALLVVAAVAAACGILPDPFATTAPATRPVAPVATLGPIGTPGAVDPASRLPIVALADLPAEAADTVALIEAGGPFPYRQDGATFENREGLLPGRPSGHYREYTVPTPGSGDRGARRIVAGADGEMFWTADHYDSFAWIDR